MAIDERSRHQLYLRLESVLGPEEANTLMEHLPPVGWADVATKPDLAQLRTATKADIDQLRTATKADIDHLQAATRADIDHLQAATRADIEINIERLRSEMTEHFNRQLHSIYTAMVGTMLGTATLSATLAFVAARVV